jgi:Tol biopolymer transport system component
LWPDTGPDFQNLRIQPLTSHPGWEADPALSPDGESIAFTWNDHAENPQIYVKRRDRGEAIKGAIHTIPVAGGAESTILNLANPNVTSAIDWSPDGERIVFSDQPPGSSQLVIYAFNLRTGEKTKLTTPPEGIWGDWSPKFSPDGKTIAFKRVTDYWLDDIYLMHILKIAKPNSYLSAVRQTQWTNNSERLSLAYGGEVTGVTSEYAFIARRSTYGTCLSLNSWRQRPLFPCYRPLFRKA